MQEHREGKGLARLKQEPHSRATVFGTCIDGNGYSVGVIAGIHLQAFKCLSVPVLEVGTKLTGYTFALNADLGNGYRVHVHFGIGTGGQRQGHLQSSCQGYEVHAHTVYSIGAYLVCFFACGDSLCYHVGIMHIGLGHVFGRGTT